MRTTTVIRRWRQDIRSWMYLQKIPVNILTCQVGWTSWLDQARQYPTASAAADDVAAARLDYPGAHAVPWGEAKKDEGESK